MAFKDYRDLPNLGIRSIMGDRMGSNNNNSSSDKIRKMLASAVKQGKQCVMNLHYDTIKDQIANGERCGACYGIHFKVQSGIRECSECAERRENGVCVSTTFKTRRAKPRRSKEELNRICSAVNDEHLAGESIQDLLLKYDLSPAVYYYRFPAMKGEGKRNRKLNKCKSIS